MADRQQARLNRMFERIKKSVPMSGGFLDWIRRPSSRVFRFPIGILLVLGGIFSILPFLGIWMLPLGLLLLALDLPFLQPPLNRSILWVQRKWTGWKRKREEKRRAGRLG